MDSSCGDVLTMRVGLHVQHVAIVGRLKIVGAGIAGMEFFGSASLFDHKLYEAALLE